MTVYICYTVVKRGYYRNRKKVNSIEVLRYRKKYGIWTRQDELRKKDKIDF